MSACMNLKIYAEVWPISNVGRSTVAAQASGSENECVGLRRARGAVMVVTNIASANSYSVLVAKSFGDKCNRKKSTSIVLRSTSS